MIVGDRQTSTMGTTVRFTGTANHDLGWAARFRIDGIEAGLPDAPVFEAEAVCPVARFSYCGATVWEVDNTVSAELVFAPPAMSGCPIEIVIHEIRTDPRLDDASLRRLGLHRSQIQGPWRHSFIFRGETGGTPDPEVD